MKGRKPLPLPIGWEAPPVADLQPSARAVAEGWPDGAYAAMEEKFRGHAYSTGWVKADWAAAWGKWVLDVAPDVARAAKAGVTFVAPTAGTSSTTEDPAGQDSCTQALGIRTLLSNRLGPKSAHAWIRPMDISVEGKRLVLSHPSKFRVDWVRDHFRAHLLPIAGDLEVEFRVARKRGNG